MQQTLAFERFNILVRHYIEKDLNIGTDSSELFFKKYSEDKERISFDNFKRMLYDLGLIVKETFIKNADERVEEIFKIFSDEYCDDEGQDYFEIKRLSDEYMDWAGTHNNSYV